MPLTFGAVKGVRHLFPGGRKAIVGGDPAAIGEAGDCRVTRFQRHHGEGMTPEFRDPRRQTGHHLHGNRIDLIILALRQVGRNAWISVGIARGPDQDGFSPAPACAMAAMAVLKLARRSCSL